MKRPVRTLIGATLLMWAPVSLLGQQAPRPASSQTAKPWVAPRAADGHPDLQGIWDAKSATPLERPREMGTREFLTDEEVKQLEQRAEERLTGASRVQSIHPPWWLDYGTKVVGTRRTSLVVDPPDGRVPALTPEAQKRAAAVRAAAASHGPLDDPENLNLWERCVTRELPEAMLPGPYNSNIQIVQTADHVMILMEMIHDARIVPLDGRPRLPSSIRPWMGDPRGRWEGETLVIETINFSNRTDYRGSGENLKLTERFTRIGPEVLEYRVTIEDPTTWVRPWTVEVPMVKSLGLYEYACHEGNYGMKNSLSNARLEERERPAR